MDTSKEQTLSAGDESYLTWEGKKSLRHFHYQHLPPHLAKVSKPFYELALLMMCNVADNRQRMLGLDLLLQAKDCMVRAYIEQGSDQTP